MLNVLLLIFIVGHHEKSFQYPIAVFHTLVLRGSPVTPESLDDVLKLQSVFALQGLNFQYS